ncbi:MAG: alkaline phosphatase [Gammaproteobacteria bacterium]|nr:alkaline phosphatase [Gammaproteobacteria bacterium]
MTEASTKRMSLRLPLALAAAAALFWVATQLFPPPTDEPEPAPLTEADAEYWREQGRQALRQAGRPSPPPPARNVILFVGDGMGVSTVTAARILAGQLAGGPGEDHRLYMETLPRTGLAKTYNVNQQVPDSAGTMTAIMTGVKTNAGIISLDGRARRGDCESSLGTEVPTLLQQAAAAGMGTGVVTTTTITHATPAATYAHAADRNWEVDSAMPAAAIEAGCQDIASQLLALAAEGGVDVALGGGRGMFMPQGMPDPEYDFLDGRRADGRDLVAEWLMLGPNSAYVWNQAQFDALTEHALPVLGLFEPSHMQFEVDRGDDPAGEPSLAAMTAFAIERLARNPNGYFLMVEGGRIDHAHHANNAWRALTDTIAMDEAVRVAGELTSADDTLIVVTADHSHPVTLAGYATRGNPVLGLVRGNDRSGAPRGESSLDGLGLPYQTLLYAIGPGHHGLSNTQEAGPKRVPHRFETIGPHPQGRGDLGTVDVTDPAMLQESVIPLSFGVHSGEDVPVFARGPGADLVSGVYEQNVLYFIMRRALADRLGE